MRKTFDASHDLFDAHPETFGPTKPKRKGWTELQLSQLAWLNTADRPDKPIIHYHQNINTTEQALGISFPLSLANGHRVDLVLDIVYVLDTGVVTRVNVNLMEEK